MFWGFRALGLMQPSIDLLPSVASVNLMDHEQRGRRKVLKAPGGPLGVRMNVAFIEPAEGIARPRPGHGLGIHF